MREWLRETHGPNFELLRHFVLRFFDSELSTTPDQWKTPAIGAFSLLLPWFPLFAQPLLHKYAHFSALATPGPYRQAVCADELWLLTLMMSAIGLLTAIKWQSLFPGLRDYQVLGTLPLRARQIFQAKFLALLIVSTIAVVVINALPGLHLPAGLGRPLANQSLPREPFSGPGHRFRGGLLFLLLRLAGAARSAAESPAAAAVWPRHRIPAGPAGGRDADPDRAQFLDRHPVSANRAPPGDLRLVAARLVPGALSTPVGRSRPGDGGPRAARRSRSRHRGGAGPGLLCRRLSAPSQAAGGLRPRPVQQRPQMDRRASRVAGPQPAPAGHPCLHDQDAGAQQPAPHDPDGLRRLRPRDSAHRHYSASRKPSPSRIARRPASSTRT